MARIRNLLDIDPERVRAIGRKVAGAAVAGAFVGGVVQAGLSDVSAQSGDQLVKAIAAQNDGGEGLAPPISVNATLADEDLATTSSEDTIDYHRLSC